jgi:ribosomal protein S18 acetylase RimI-like enzyme
MQSCVQIRKIGLGDLKWCEFIDSCNAAAGRWTQQDFCTFLHGSWQGGYVAVFHEQRLGFVLYRACRESRQLHLERIGVHPDWQRRHIGNRLLAHIRQWLRPVPDVKVTALVHERQLPVQCFLRANGFRVVRICKGHFDHGASDAYFFELSAGDPAALARSERE